MSWWSSASGRSYGLTIQGIPVIQHVPIDVQPITWEAVGPDASGRMSFVYFGPRNLIVNGAEVRLRDNTNARTLFGGILLGRTLRRGPGDLVWTEVECASYDWFLDHRLVPRYENKRDVGNRVRYIHSDRQIVKDLIERRGGFIEANNDYIDQTNTSMDKLELEGETLRSALEKIADEASSTAGRHFYVDDDKYLHWYSGTEGLASPYRISDGSYVRTVIDTSGLVELWTLREESGTTNHGARGVQNLTLSGSYSQGVTNIAVVNEPAYRSILYSTDGRSSADAAASSLFPGDTFSLEWWQAFSGTGTVRTVWLTTGGSDDSYWVRWTAADKLEIVHRTAVQHWISDDAFTDLGWHHYVVARSPGSTLVYRDGQAIAGTTTPQTFGSATNIRVGNNIDNPPGRMQHAAVYSSKLSAATVLAHYRQGVSLVPSDLEVEYDSAEERHFAYVVSEVKGGSGWVRGSAASTWPLGPAQMYVEARKVKTEGQRERRGKAALRRHRQITSCSFEIVGYHGWRPGQLVPVTESTFGLSSDTFEIKSVSGELSAGNAATYRIETGALRRRISREVRRRRRRSDD